MIPKRLEDVTEVDLVALIENQVREGRTIEYKRELPANSDVGKGKLLAGVSSFANTSGGTSSLALGKKRVSLLRLSVFNALIWTGRYFGLNKRWILDWSRGFGVVFRSSIVAKARGSSCFESTEVGLDRIGFLFKREGFGEETLLESIRWT